MMHLTEEEQAFARAGTPIKAIKSIRERTGLGLKEAKALFDFDVKLLGIVPPKPAPVPVYRQTEADLRADLAQANAIIEAMLAAIRGEPVDDFMSSFGPVREAMDLYHERKTP